MQLEPKVASAIVDSLKDIIHHEINLFDTTGTIIASTDAKRVGTFHDGAYQVIKSRQPVIISSDDEFHGARKGTNLPVLFNDSVVAVIGITGDPDTVAPLGNIIKKMTEILIRENWSQMTRYTRQANFNSLVAQLIAKEHDRSLIDYLMAVLEVQPDTPRQVVVAQVLAGGKRSASYTEAAETIVKYLQSLPQTFYTATGSEICLMLEHQPATEQRRLLDHLQSELSTACGQPVAIGIGRQVQNINDYWRSYQDAEAALSWQLFTKQASVQAYAQLDYQLLLTKLPQQVGKDFLNQVLKKIPADQLPEFKEVLNAYVTHNGSIIHGAEAMFIHKNTFQNRLNLIHTTTGYNPRELRDFVVLYLAFQLDDYYHFQNQRHQQ